MHNSEPQLDPNSPLHDTFGAQTSDFFEKIISIAPSILYVFDLVEMRNIWVNRSMFLDFGYSQEEIDEMGGKLLPKLMHPDDWKRYPAHFEALKTLKAGHKLRFEYRLKDKDDAWRWLASEEMPFAFADDGTVTQIVGSAHDISGARSREERIKLLVREMNHRTKNLFSVVLSMVKLTAKTKANAPTKDAFETLHGRVNALSISQSLSLPSANDNPVSAQKMVEKILAPYADDHTIMIGGDNPALPSATAQSLAMVLHELATNAVKYGALSNEGGSLEIVLSASDDNRLRVGWTEDATFEISAPADTKGFGMRLVQRSFRQMRGSVDLNWAPSGLVVQMEIPLKAP